jgi:hypothetical protein
MKRIASIMATTALVLGLFAASPSAVSATSFAPAADVDHWVSKGGRLVNDASGGYSCSRPGYRLIADAADAAEPGDVIHVCRGTYLEDDIELPSDFTSGITIQGDGPNRTFVDARSNGRVFINWMSGNGLSDVADDTSGINQLVASNLRIADMTLRNANANASDYSTGIDADGGFIGVGGDLFDDLGGAVLSVGRVECNNVRFTGNEAEAGGAIASVLGVTANRCSFTGNSSEFSGGAIWSLASVHDSGGVYTANTTGGDFGGFGGAVYSSNYFGFIFALEAGDFSHLTSTFTNTAFSKNFSVDGGGAAAIELGCAEFTNSSFTKNSTNGAGGGLYLNEGSFITLPIGGPGGPGNGLVCQSEILGSKFESNSAVSAMGSLNVGGALAYFGGLDDSSTGFELEYDDTVGLRMSSTTFKSNAAANGGAVFMDDGILRSTGAVYFNGNRARQNGVGGVGGYGSGVYAVDHSVFTGSFGFDTKNRATYEPNSVVHHENGTLSWYWGEW